MNAKSGHATHLGVGEQLTKRKQSPAVNRRSERRSAKGQTRSSVTGSRELRVRENPGARPGATAPWISRPRWWVVILFSPFPVGRATQPVDGFWGKVAGADSLISLVQQKLSH